MAAGASVVVVGGGVMGCSIAFHLAERGIDTLVLERGTVCSGMTARSGALVRMHYTNPHDSALAQQSLAYFQHWGDLVGAGDPGYRQAGVARLVEPRFDERLRANVAMLQGLGVNTEVISPDDLRAIDPGVQTGDITCAAWEPESGYADPAATAYGFAEAARRLGADVH